MPASGLGLGIKTALTFDSGLKGFSTILEYFARRRRIRSLTRVVHQHSRKAFPQDRPVWTMVDEDRPDECVVYVTYEHDGRAEARQPHRFFKVQFPEMTVTNMAETYHPERWGPYR